MGTTAWYVADTSGIRWGRAAAPGTGGVLPVEVTHLGSVPPWSAWTLRRTAFGPGTHPADLVVLRRAVADADGDGMPASDFVLHLFPLLGLPAEQGPR
jgi:hypothetical protein